MKGKVLKFTASQKDICREIEERAAFFGCPGKVKGIVKGPVITVYEFEPGKSTRVKKLQGIHEDLALTLSAEAVNVSRIPGKNLMAIAISNDAEDRKNTSFRQSLQAIKAAKKAGIELPLNLGIDPYGKPVIDDLTVLPHLLIAGSTGAGKSVSLNCIISSLLTVCPPEELKFMMIDPKGVEMVHYEGIPHLTESMITSPHYAKDALERLTIEMRKRLLILTNERVRDIHHLNVKRKKYSEPLMPRIVVIVDELGDLMLQDRKEFIKLFAEISQISRATGIHMICATQRPSVDVLPGKIKVNFPGRMSFRVTSSVDSKTIIQQRGAENLLGRGDMLYLSPQRVGCVRVHAPWVPIEEIKELTEKIKAAAIAEMKVDIKPKVETTTTTEAEIDKNIPIDLDWHPNKS